MRPSIIHSIHPSDHYASTGPGGRWDIHIAHTLSGGRIHTPDLFIFSKADPPSIFALVWFTYTYAFAHSTLCNQKAAKVFEGEKQKPFNRVWGLKVSWMPTPSGHVESVR